MKGLTTCVVLRTTAESASAESRRMEHIFFERDPSHVNVVPRLGLVPGCEKQRCTRRRPDNNIGGLRHSTHAMHCVVPSVYVKHPTSFE